MEMPSILDRMGTQPPSGAPATGMKEPNGAGDIAEAASLVRQSTKLLEAALQRVGAGSPAGGDLLKVLTKLTKLFPPDASNAGMDAAALKGVMQAADQKSPMASAMSGVQANGGPSIPNLQ